MSEPRVTTFATYPEPPDEPADGAHFSTDLQQTQGVTPGPDQRPTTRMSKITRRATGLGLNLIESLMRSTIRVEGVEHVQPGPVLFVANHFTRFETFVLPYLIDGHIGRYVHSLAYHKLFGGRFGDFLMSIGARPTGDPIVKHTMVEDLMTGRHDWLIYPEGSMIKNKKIWAKGHYEIDSPDRAGMPHTGAAIMALKAMIYKRLYRQACERGELELKGRYERRYHLAGPQDVAVPDLQIIPINITYFPIRPGRNLVSRLARWLFRQMPSVLDEELAMEGSLLLSETDISVYFGKPLQLDHYLSLVMPTLQRPLPFLDQLRRANHIMGALKNRLTRRMMHTVYNRLTVNLDHLFCAGLRQVPGDRIRCEDFHQSIYLAARRLQADGRRRSHPSIGPDLVDVVTGAPSPALASVRGLAELEGTLRVEDGHYVINHTALAAEHSFHDIRLKNVVAVIANELEPMRKAVHHLRAAIGMSRTERRREVARLFEREAIEEFIAERHVVAASPHLKEESVGRPFLLQRKGNRIGVVISHGYLAAPPEVRALAEHLHRLGFAVCAPRLTGHGTAPERLATATAEDWLRDYRRAVMIMRGRCDHVVLAGFSAGGLLALAAAAGRDDVLGVLAINPCLRLADRKSRLVPAVVGFNHLLDRAHIPGGRFDHVVNHAENPDINYPLNYLGGLYQLERLMTLTSAALPQVRSPALVIQGDHDPVVDPSSGRLTLDGLGSEEKELALMSFARHVIISGEGAETVHERVAEFITHLAERVGHPPLRARCDDAYGPGCERQPPPLG